MTTTTVHGITVALITEEQICQAMDNIMADWPKGQYQQLRRYVKDTLHDCAVLAGHYEDAARLRANNGTPPCQRLEGADTREMLVVAPQPSNLDHAVAFHKLAANLICPPAVDELEAHIAAARGIPARVKA